MWIEMWCQIIFICSVIAVSLGEITAPGIDREVGDGISSMGYKMVYGDEDMTVINEVVSDMEKNAIRKKMNINEALPPLPAQDVKCLMSVDKYCSKEMGEMKNILVHALKDDCKDCTDAQKDKAGKVAASMMAHDPVAWKTFLTRCALQNNPPKPPLKQNHYTLTPIGEPEEIVKSKYRHTKPGFNIRVKKYLAVKTIHPINPAALFGKHPQKEFLESSKD